MLFPQLFFVIFMGGMMRGYSAPYFNLFLGDLGYSGTFIGTVLSVSALVELFLIPLFSRVADRRNSHRRMYRWLMLGYVGACMAMLVFPTVVVLVAGMLIVNVNLRSTFVFAMQLGFTKMEQTGKELAGWLRSMSAGGFMVSNATAGGILALRYPYAWMFSLASVAGMVAVAFSNALPQNTTDKPNVSGKSVPIMRNRRLLILLASQFFITMGVRNMLSFWLLHFQNNVGVRTETLSLIVTFAAIFEIPWFLFLDRWIQRGHAAVMYLSGALLLGVYGMFIAEISSMWLLFALLIPRGVGFAMWNLSILVLVNKISHPSNVSTNQALGQITIPSIAGLVSGAPMGYIYDHFSPYVFFGVLLGVSAVGSTIMLVNLRQFRV